MESNFFKRTPIAAAVALAIGSMSTATAQAEDAQADQIIEEIVVTGIRGSLIKSMDRKRYADGVVDSITAEDNGDFPDTNLAES